MTVTTDFAAKVLLVEDNPAEAHFTQRALSQSKVLCDFEVTEHGLEAQELLLAGYRPNLILLDLNMPVMDGREFLEWIKTHEELRHIPVIVMTTSEDRSDIMQAWEHQCAAYITKPVALPGLSAALRQLADFYFVIVQLPQLEGKRQRDVGRD